MWTFCYYRNVRPTRMPNERLRNSISAAHLTLDALAERLQVDRKTVERWVAGRVPHPRHRQATATVLHAEQTYLWPELMTEARTRSATEAEFVTLYPHRGAVPPDLWLSLTEAAEESIDILVYAGLFLWDAYPDFPSLVAAKARAGTRIRLALGDPESEAVALRGVEEGFGGLSGRVRMTLAYVSSVSTTPGVGVRLHSTTLYNSIYRFDDNLFINPHTYGAPAARSPVIHLRRVAGGRLFDHYMGSFDRVWSTATPLVTHATELMASLSGGSHGPD